MTVTRQLPTGIVTFLFTDIEGSTKLVQDLGPAVGDLFDAHAEIIRFAVAANHGVEVNTDGDAFFCVFVSARDAVNAAAASQRALHDHEWPEGGVVKVRMGLHTGSGTIGGEDYFGIDVHRASRVADAGHGGQVVISDATRVAVGDELPAGIHLRDLGLHRMKDLTAPEHLCDLVIEGLPDAFPPLRTLQAMGSRIPEPLSSFIGRQDEVDAIADVASSARLITLTGPGGIGKSRLSLQVADRLAARFDGVFFVPLAPVTDPRLVPSTILHTLGDPPTGEDSTTRLASVLADKKWLLILDNFEQVVDAAPAIASLLSAAPAVTFVVTSQVPLGISGESEYVVAPLSLATESDAGEAMQSEAVRLFIDRALQVRPDLELDEDTVAAIVDITNALDGLPLAIELAAARVRVLAPTAIRQRMGSLLDLLSSGPRDLEPRQRTLRGAISWSYDLLTEPQQLLLEDFSVFRGGATLDAIEAACGLNRTYWEWLEGLDALVSHSLITRVETPTASRFVVYEMIREFAAEKLVERGNADSVAEHHFSYFLDLAQKAAPGLLGSDQGTWLSTLDQERDNLLAALGWVMDRGDAHRAAEMAFALWRFWHMRGPIPEGADRVAKILTMEQLESEDRLLVLEAAGGLAWWSGDMDGSEARYHEAVDIARTCGTDVQLANALYNAGLSLAFGGSNAGAGSLLDEGLAIAERIGDDPMRAKLLWAMASVDQFDGDFQAALAKVQIALPLFEAADDQFMVHWAKRELGASEIALGDIDSASHHVADALRFFSSTGDRSGVILLLRDHARIAALRGDNDHALRIIGATTQHEEDSRLKVGQFELEMLGLENPVEITDPEAAQRLLDEGRMWSLEQAVEYALSDSLPSDA